MPGIELGDLCIEVVRKDIRNLHLSVLPPEGRVRIAVPRGMKLETVRVFAISKLGWIRAEQRKMKSQEREAPREYLDRESHYVWGRRYLLKRVEREAAPGVELSPRRLILTLRPGTDARQAAKILEAWYRQQVRAAASACIAEWAPVIGVRAERVFVQRMKTRWGSCNPAAGAIRLNTELAKKPPECLEYIVVHELMHLIERKHNARFSALMALFMPHAQERRRLLNALPVAHQEWEY